MNYFQKTSLLAVALVLLFDGCYYDNFTELHPSTMPATCDTAKVISFSNNVVPLLNNSCGTSNSCHGASNTSSVDLSNYTGVNAVAINGQLVSSVVWDGTMSAMPKGSSVPLSICDQTIIKKWVAAGALNN